MVVLIGRRVRSRPDPELARCGRLDYASSPPQSVRSIRVVPALTNISGVDGTVQGVPLGVAVDSPGLDFTLGPLNPLSA